MLPHLRKLNRAVVAVWLSTGEIIAFGHSAEMISMRLNTKQHLEENRLFPRLALCCSNSL